MKRILISLLSLVLIVCCLFASGCKKPKTFGEFCYNNIWLYSFASRDISYNEAKQIVQTGMSSTLYNGGVTLLSTTVTPLSVNPTDPLQAPLPADDLVNAVTSKYASVEIVTKYYVTGEKDQLTKVDTPMGTDFKSIIRYNELRILLEIDWRRQFVSRTTRLFTTGTPHTVCADEQRPTLPCAHRKACHHRKACPIHSESWRQGI